jgi:ribosome-associated protein
LGEDILLLDIRPVAAFADFFVICSGNSERQLEALHRDIREQAHQLGIQAVLSEGTGSSGWIILDFGAIVVHLFLPNVRRHYDLEHLWQDGLTLLLLL